MKKRKIAALIIAIFVFSFIPSYASSNVEGSLYMSVMNADFTEMRLSCEEYTYDGTEKKPSVSIGQLQGTTFTNVLVENVDYTLEYYNCVEPGTATVVATGTGLCSGTISATYIIEEPVLDAIDENLVASGTLYGTNVSWELRRTDEGMELYYQGTGTIKENNDDAIKNNKSSIKRIVIEEGIAEIGNRAFNSYDGLEEVIIPDSVTSIGSFAFDQCSQLQEIIIPDSVTDLGAYAFNKCSNLISVTMSNNVTRFSESAFGNCNKLVNINTPEGLTYIGTAAFFQCYELSSLDIPDSVTSIGSTAFYRCRSLKAIHLPNQLKSVAKQTFDGCSGIETIVIPQGVTSIGENAFANCANLTSITIPDSVTSIHNYSFYNSSKAICYINEGSYAQTFFENTSYFGYKYDLNTGHQVENWSIIKAPKCEEPGTGSGRCKTCRRTVTDTIPATGHTWNEEYTLDTHATVSSEGSESIHCSVCNAIQEGSARSIDKIVLEDIRIEDIPNQTFTAEYIEPDPVVYLKDQKLSLGDDYTLNYLNNVNVGTAEVQLLFNEYYGKNTILSATFNIVEADHVFGEWITTKNETCTVAGSKNRTCKGCGKVETASIPATGHNFGAWTTIKSATADTPGLMERTCRYCGAVEKKSISKMASYSGTCAHKSEINKIIESYRSRASWDDSVPRLNWKANEASMELLKIVAHELDTGGKYYSQIENADDSYSSYASWDDSVPRLNWKANEASMNLLKSIAHILDTSGKNYTQIENADDSYSSYASWDDSVPRLNWKAKEACMDLLKIIAHELDNSGADYTRIEQADDSYSSYAGWDDSIPRLTWKADEASMNLLIYISHKLDTDGINRTNIDHADDSYASYAGWDDSVPRLDWKANEASMDLLSICAIGAESHAADKAWNGIRETKLAKIKLSSAKSSKKTVVVKWKKLTKKQQKKCSKIEVQYSLKKSFPRKETVTKTVKRSATSFKTKKLKVKKRYYFRVRTIKRVNGVKYVGAWSKTKSVKIKK